jgi:hypothetical protein
MIRTHRAALAQSGNRFSTRQTRKRVCVARSCSNKEVHERRNPLSNNPLMAGEEHWKSGLVPPMFQTHPLASIPGLPEDARR